MRFKSGDLEGHGSTAVRYRDEIIQPHLMHVIDRQRELIQQDNARPHTARVTMDYLEQNNINVLTSSAYTQSNFSHCFLVLFAIPVATFGGVDRGSDVEVVAGAHVYPADPIGVQ
jgi:hypothetical protein